MLVVFFLRDLFVALFAGKALWMPIFADGADARATDRLAAHVAARHTGRRIERLVTGKMCFASAIILLCVSNGFGTFSDLFANRIFDFTEKHHHSSTLEERLAMQRPFEMIDQSSNLNH
jgi:hypothetical protein